MIHELKCNSRYFQEIRKGTKKFEVRKNDRDFLVGDYLALNEVDGNGDYTDESIMAKITYILSDPEYCKESYIIMSLDDRIMILEEGENEDNYTR